jgi:glycosyltransferase involved in cell wall biosynthesis
MRASSYREWDKLEVCALGVDTAEFEPRPFRPSPSPFEVICVGRLTSVKAQHVLIGATDRLVRSGADVVLRLVGDGPDRDALERQAAERGLGDRVRFEGWLNQDRVRALYEKADAFALASFAEGVPVVLMEAMAMEIPCVATNITGIPELIRNGIDGILVSPSDEEALAVALRELIDDPALRVRLGKAGRQRVVEKYDLGRNCAAFAGVLRERLHAAARASAP